MDIIKASFSGFSVNDIAAARDFYVNKLGFTLDDDSMGLHMTVPGGNKIFAYQKEDHKAATFTILNLVVTDIDAAMDDFVAKGVTFEHYPPLGNGAKQDEKGILRGLAANMGPDIAWFKDPAGNILS